MNQEIVTEAGRTPRTRGERTSIPTSPPLLGRIAEASMAVRAAESALAEASTALYEKHMELRALQAAPPVRRTRPEDILQELTEEDEHAEQCQSLKRHVAKLERIVAQRQAEALALRADHERLLGLLRQIETSAIPAARRDVAEAESRLVQATRDAANLVRVATADAEGARARLQRLAAERRALTGEQGGRGHG